METLLWERLDVLLPRISDNLSVDHVETCVK